MPQCYKNIIRRNGIGNSEINFGLVAVAPFMCRYLDVFFEGIQLGAAVEKKKNDQ